MTAPPSLLWRRSCVSSRARSILLVCLLLAAPAAATNCGSYTCPAGTSLRGNPSMITCTGGPPCTSNAANNLLCCATDCTVPTVAGGATVGCVEGSTVVHTTVCPWTAEAGYTCTGLATQTCTDGVFPGAAFACTPDACPAYTAANAAASFVTMPATPTNCDVVGETPCPMTCVTGYASVATPSLQCSPGGLYTILNPCTAIACKSTGTISNSDANADYSPCNNLVTGTSCTPACNAGYAATGTAFTLTCLNPPAGDFDAQSTASCTLVTCTGFNAAANNVAVPVTTTCDDATEGTCALTCLAGFTGSPVLQCTGTTNPGTWSVTGTVCADNCMTQTAQALVGTTLPANAVVGTCVAGAFTVGTPTCAVTACATGYTAAGSSTVTCSAAGVLSVTTAGLTCTETPCPAYVLPTGTAIGTCPANLLPITAPTCTLACAAGYAQTSGTTTLSCSTAAPTPTTTLVCSAIRCTTTPAWLANNAIATTLTPCDSVPEAACPITCAPNYASGVGAELKCVAADTWQFNNPCIAMNCGVFDFATNHITTVTVTPCDDVHEATCATTCLAGWTGTPTLDCIGTGTWSIANPCTENSCSAYTIPAEAEGTGADACTAGIVLSSTTDPSCGIACKTGYIPLTTTLNCASTANAGDAPTTAVPLLCQATCGLHTCATAHATLRPNPQSVVCHPNPCSDAICCVGVIVNPHSVTTTERGQVGEFTVVLVGPPTADVLVPIVDTMPTEGTISSGGGFTGPSFTLTFANANWHVARTVRVTPIDDFVLDGDQTYIVEVRAATSADVLYAGKDGADVTVTCVDNERTLTETLTLSPTATTSLSLTYSLSETYSLSPTATETLSPTFTVTLTSSETSTLTFTASPTLTYSLTETLSLSATMSETPSFTFSLTDTLSLSATESATLTLTPSTTETLSLTDTISLTETITLSLTDSLSHTLTESLSETFTLTLTHSLTSTFTESLTFTETLTETFSLTQTYTLSPTDTLSLTETYTQSLTFSESATETYSLSLSFTLTDTQTLPTPTETLTKTFTLPTRTETFTSTLTLPTETVTLTDSYTLTPTDTLTAHSLTETETGTDTATLPTLTPSLTSTETLPTPSGTSTFTDTMPTETETDTIPIPTLTTTFTDSFTASESFTESEWTVSSTLSVTDTFIRTATETLRTATLPTPTATDTTFTTPAPDATENEVLKIREPRVSIGDTVAVETGLSKHITFGEVLEVTKDFGQVKVRTAVHPTGFFYDRIHPFAVLEGDSQLVRGDSAVWKRGKITGTTSDRDVIVAAEGSVGIWSETKPANVSFGEYVAMRQGPHEPWKLGYTALGGRIESMDGTALQYRQVVSPGHQPGDPVKVRECATNTCGYLFGVVERVSGTQVFVRTELDAGKARVFPVIMPYVVPGGGSCWRLDDSDMVARNAAPEAWTRHASAQVSTADGLLTFGGAAMKQAQTTGARQGKLVLGGATATATFATGLLVPTPTGLAALTVEGKVEPWTVYWLASMVDGETLELAKPPYTDVLSGNVVDVENLKIEQLGAAPGTGLVGLNEYAIVKRGFPSFGRLVVRDEAKQGWKAGFALARNVVAPDVTVRAARIWKHIFPASLLTGDVVAVRNIVGEEWQVGTVVSPMTLSAAGDVVEPSVQPVLGVPGLPVVSRFSQTLKAALPTNGKVWVKDDPADGWTQGVVVQGGTEPRVTISTPPSTVDARPYPLFRPAEVAVGDLVACRDGLALGWAVGQVTFTEADGSVHVNTSVDAAPRWYRQIVPLGFRNPVAQPPAQPPVLPVRPPVFVREKAYVRDSVDEKWVLGDVEFASEGTHLVSKAWTELSPSSICTGMTTMVRDVHNKTAGADENQDTDLFIRGTVDAVREDGVPLVRTQGTYWRQTTPAGYRVGDEVLVKDETGVSLVSAIVVEVSKGGVAKAASVSGESKVWDFMRPKQIQKNQRVLVRNFAHEPWLEGIVVDPTSNSVAVTYGTGKGAPAMPYHMLMPMGFRAGDFAMVSNTTTGVGPFTKGSVVSVDPTTNKVVVQTNEGQLEYPHIHPAYTTALDSPTEVAVKDRDEQVWRFGTIPRSPLLPSTGDYSQVPPLVETYPSPWTQFRSEADYKKYMPTPDALGTPVPATTPAQPTSAPLVLPDPGSIKQDTVLIRVGTQCADVRNASCFNTTAFKEAVSQEMDLKGCGFSLKEDNGVDIVKLQNAGGPTTPEAFFFVSFDDCAKRGWTSEDLAKRFNATVLGDPDVANRVASKGYPITASQYLSRAGAPVGDATATLVVDPSTLGAAGAGDDDSIPIWPFILGGVLLCCCLLFVAMCLNKQSERRRKDEDAAAVIAARGPELNPPSELGSSQGEMPPVHYDMAFTEFTPYEELDVKPDPTYYARKSLPPAPEPLSEEPSLPPPPADAFGALIAEPSPDPLAAEGGQDDGYDEDGQPAYRSAEGPPFALRPSTRAGMYSRRPGAPGFMARPGSMPPMPAGRGTVSGFSAIANDRNPLGGSASPGDQRAGQHFPVVI